MTRPSSDRLRRLELALLATGALGASLLLAVNARADLGHLLGEPLPRLQIGIYSMKLLMMEAALLAPFVVLALLGRALRRETGRSPYRWAGLGISLGASAGVLAMLLAGLVPIDLEEALDTLVASVVPALVLLTACAGLYGGLIRLARHAKLETITPGQAKPASPPPRG